MRRLLPLSGAFLFAAGAAFADTLCLANGGTVAGTVLEVRLRIGPIEKVLSREQIASLKVDGARWHAIDSEKAHYLGALESVAIRCVAGTLTFGGKSVKGIEFAADKESVAQPTAVMPQQQELEPTAEPSDPGEVRVSEEEKAQVTALLKVAARLRDAYMERAAKLEKDEHLKFRNKYLPEYQAACGEVKQRADAYAKFGSKGDVTRRQFDSGGLGFGLTRTTTITKDGPAGEALHALELAEAKKRGLMLKIKAAHDEIAQVASARKERIRAYYAAITRDLAAGKLISEEAMDKIYAQALAVRAD